MFSENKIKLCYPFICEFVSYDTLSLTNSTDDQQKRSVLQFENTRLLQFIELDPSYSETRVAILCQELSTKKTKIFLIRHRYSFEKTFSDRLDQWSV